MPLCWGREVDACSVEGGGSGGWGCFFFFLWFGVFLSKIRVLYAHMMNILFKICEMDHLNRTGSCNTGGGKRDSFVVTLLKYILYNRICHSNLEHLQKFDDAFVSCFFLKYANTYLSESFKTTYFFFIFALLSLSFVFVLSVPRDRAQVKHP